MALRIAAVAAALMGVCAFCPLRALCAADRLAPLDLRHVTVGGEIGRRINVTVHNNLLQLKVDEDFLKPFRERKSTDEFVGLGTLLDATVQFAAYTGEPKVLALKRYLTREIIKLQAPDGYLGTMKPEGRMWSLWDIHEMGYLVYGLCSDYELFGERASLASARSWPITSLPAGRPTRAKTLPDCTRTWWPPAWSGPCCASARSAGIRATATSAPDREGSASGTWGSCWGDGERSTATSMPTWRTAWPNWTSTAWNPTPACCARPGGRWISSPAATGW